MVLSHQSQYVVNAYADLFHQFQLIDHFILYRLILAGTLFAFLFIYVIMRAIPAQIVLHLELCDDQLVGRKLVETRQQVLHLQHSTHQFDKLLAFLFTAQVSQLLNGELL